VNHNNLSEKFVDTSLVSIREIPKDIAKDIIIKNHYSHKWSLCTHAIGIFYKSGVEDCFFETDEILIGCLVYGNPVGRSAAASISEEIKPNEVLELVRLFIEDGYGKNIESYCIARSFDWIRKFRPDIRALISYADVEQNHRGGIYQATGWIYQGNSAMSLMPNYSVSLTNDPYEWIHSRTVFEKFGSHNIEHLKKTIGKTFYRKKESTKHRYVYFLGNKIDKKKLVKSMKHPAQPYPKGNCFVEEIETFVVDENPNKDKDSMFEI